MHATPVGRIGRAVEAHRFSTGITAFAHVQNGLTDVTPRSAKIESTRQRLKGTPAVGAFAWIRFFRFFTKKSHHTLRSFTLIVLHEGITYKQDNLNLEYFQTQA
jgi:hypothetical protein